ncbi:NADH-ubiquinone oxidoreductase chain N [Thioalkalivibrio nitratireducens DSM 14787]|uniref:NADH-quinone oxidoreductase subunit N n=1 Tax=Thioalkalivibrio nitratireducens (strain DSM 14787 / UNIQEM 213 / ALEN2) TaxID=1255043 RepID=L0DVH3_THIND|nr:NADH-quinone oxidoreductase subunit N [Thioalkalivibrio nitratireducens]AGA33604.1 NADH-ubiquinone oxidoreductase chain N [Thioalkalivibrio nitratireducens DSM 14787]
MTPDGLLLAALPEHLLLLGILAILTIDLVSSRPRDPFMPALITVLAAGAAAFSLHTAGHAGAPFPGHFSVDADAFAAKTLLFGLAVPVLFLARAERFDGRFAMLLLASLYGAGLLLSADSLVMLFFGLELLSLPLYALVVLTFRRPESAEAALKYLVLGGVGTAVLLMGVSLTLGATGGLTVDDFRAALASGDVLARGAVVLVVAAFMLKAAIVPFHAWAPDAYEGASVPATAFMATIVKAAVVLALVRLFGPAGAGPGLVAVLIALPLLSMVWGNLAAMRQQGFRRLIAYSSIAHAGYLFLALLGLPDARFEAMAFYVLVYGLTTLLALACLPSGEDWLRDRLNSLKGLYHRDPRAAILIAVAMLSLAGIPPFPGFVAKFLIFRTVMDAGLVAVAVIGLIASYLGIYLYLRVIQYMFMNPAASHPRTEPASGHAAAAALLLVAAVVLVGVFPGVVLGWL